MSNSAMERLILAKQSLNEGDILLRELMGNKLVLAKFYHAMMQCLFALFDVRDAAKLTHADLIHRFEREYVRTGMIDSSVLAVLRRTYDLTHECDCEHMPVPTDEEVAASRRTAEKLVLKAAALLILKKADTS